MVQVCLEVGPKATGAFLPAYPGCWVFGRNQNAALGKAKEAALAWHGWIRSHGEKVESPSTIKTDPVEVMHVSYNPAEAGKPEPLFWSEIPAVSFRDVDRTLRLMRYSRSDLLGLCSNLDKPLLSWKPRSEPRSIANCLRHIAMAEWWYVTRLDIDLPRNFPTDVFELLARNRHLAELSLVRLTEDQRRSVFQPENDPSPVCNLWTARKVLRRFVDHERLHTGYIKRIAASYQFNSKS